MLRSISGISKVFQTSGSNPVKILCEDFNEYVCKYSRHNPASSLFNEYLAAVFLKIWNLKVPDFHLVNIQQQHITNEFIGNTIQPRFFDTPTFGSQYVEHAKEIDSSISAIEGDKKLIKRISNKQDLLSIALFDLWMGNEDRSHNNYNLLLRSDPEYAFMPIDHERCFNGNSVTSERGFVILTEDETLLNTELASLIFRNYKGLPNLVDEIAANYYLWVADCEKTLENTINAMPDQWGIQKEDRIALLKSTLFQKVWIDECKSTFEDYATRFLKP
jgi:hypothetical protein